MQKPILVFKYGGNAMKEAALQEKILAEIIALQDAGFYVVIVHGGGPFIQDALKEAQIESEFIDGHRKTTPHAYQYVEMALKGRVNGTLVNTINKLGKKAVGLSGKDGQMAIAVPRLHRQIVDGKTIEHDLGQVGDIQAMDVQLPQLLLREGYLPVITCLAANAKGEQFNVNADMFAGHLAGALKAREYIVLTDVDGLCYDKDDPSTLIREFLISDFGNLKSEGVIQGGMIPKVESCQIALQKGAQQARIINGTKPEQIAQLSQNTEVGTLIHQKK